VGDNPTKHEYKMRVVIFYMEINFHITW